MFEVNGTTIRLTRGDTFYATVTLTRNGQAYTPDPDDVIRFAVKGPLMTPDGGNYLDDTPLIRKTVPNDTMVLTLLPTDTKTMKFGLYNYDIQVTLANGDVDTVVFGDLELMPEVD